MQQNTHTCTHTCMYNMHTKTHTKRFSSHCAHAIFTRITHTLDSLSPPRLSLSLSLSLSSPLTCISCTRMIGVKTALWYCRTSVVASGLVRSHEVSGQPFMIPRSSSWCVHDWPSPVQEMAGKRCMIRREEEEEANGERVGENGEMRGDEGKRRSRSKGRRGEEVKKRRRRQRGGRIGRSSV